MRRARALVFWAVAVQYVVVGFAQQPAPLTVELKVSGSHFRAGEPIVVDMWIENQTDKDIKRPPFSPLSSIVGLPKFVIRREPSGWGFAIPPGLYGEVESWASWYQPAAQFPVGALRLRESLSVGGLFVLPAGPAFICCAGICGRRC